MSERPPLPGISANVEEPPREKGLTRRQVLKGIAGLAAAGLGLPTRVSGRERPPLQESESESVLDAVSTIVLDEFTAFCDRGSVYDTVELLWNEYAKTLRIIEEKIKKVDPNVLSGPLTTGQLQQMMKVKGLFLELSDNIISVQGQSKVVLFSGLRKILETTQAPLAPYIPPRVQFSQDQLPTVAVRTVGPNLIANFEPNLKEAAGLESFSPRGTMVNGEVIIFEQGIRAFTEEYPKLSQQEAREVVIANEMGHVLMDYFFTDYKKEEYADLQFKASNGKQYTFQQLDEAVSDLVQLNYLRDNRAAFVITLNEKLGHSGIFGGYQFSTDMITTAVNKSLNTLGLKRMDVPEQQFPLFQEKLLQHLMDGVLKLIPSLIEFLEKKKKSQIQERSK